MTFTSHQLNMCNYLIEIYKSDDTIRNPIETLKNLLSVNMRSYFDWKENLLSPKFHKYKLNTNEENKEIADYLDSYLNAVCSVTNLDSTGRAYFSLYKISRLYTNLISNQKNYFSLTDPYPSMFFKKFMQEKCTCNFLVENNDNNNNCDTSIKELNENEKFYNKQNTDDVEFLCFKFSNLTISGEFLMRTSFRSLSINKTVTESFLSTGCRNKLKSGSFVKNLTLKMQNIVVYGFVYFNYWSKRVDRNLLRFCLFFFKWNRNKNR